MSRDNEPSPEPPEPAPPSVDEWGLPVLGPGQCLCQPADLEAGCTCDDDGGAW